MRPIVAICCFCQKLRDDSDSKPGTGPWGEVAVFLKMHGLKIEDIQFSHGYCPSCLADYRICLASENRAAAQSPLQEV